MTVRLIRPLAPLLLLLLAACGPLSTPFTGPMVMGDSDPIRFPGRQPDTCPVRGMDAARFQPSVDWARA